MNELNNNIIDLKSSKEQIEIINTLNSNLLNTSATPGNNKKLTKQQKEINEDNYFVDCLNLNYYEEVDSIKDILSFNFNSLSNNSKSKTLPQVQFYGISIQGTHNKELDSENPLIAISTIPNYEIEKQYPCSVEEYNNNKKDFNELTSKDIVPSDSSNNSFIIFSIEYSFSTKENEFLKDTTKDIINKINKNSNNNDRINNIDTNKSTTDNNTEYKFFLKENFIQENLELPLSKIMFSPTQPDRLATINDYLSIYQVKSNSNKKESKKSEKKHNQLQENLDEDELNTESSNCVSCERIELNDTKENQQAPLTSFDWNRFNNSLLVTSSYDTTCTIWDLNKGKISTRLIAHDKEVYDVSFMNNDNVFVTCGADSSLRLFDIRDLDNLSILFEANETSALTRLSINPYNDTYILAVPADKPYFYLIDCRDTTCPAEIIQKHISIINSVKWSSEIENHFLSSSDDKNLFIWDLSKIHTKESKYQFTDGKNPINNADWKQGLVAINCYDTLRVLKY